MPEWVSHWFAVGQVVLLLVIGVAVHRARKRQGTRLFRWPRVR